MRISHTELEHCQRRPHRWLREKASAQAHGFPMSYRRALLSSIYEFHKQGSAPQARRYLREKINKYDFKDSSKVKTITHSLNAYIAWANKSSLINIDYRVRIKLDVGGLLELRGEVGRVDMTQRGYRAIILKEPPPHWQQQLRMPLIQKAIAEQFGRPLTLTEVGFQELDGTALTCTSFTRAQIKTAAKKFRDLGENIRHLAPSLAPGLTL